MPSTMSFTDLMERTSSSGIEILKAFSSSNSKVKTSRESMPSSCRLVSMLIFSAGIFLTDARVEITFSATTSAIPHSPFQKNRIASQEQKDGPIRQVKYEGSPQTSPLRTDAITVKY